MTGQVNEHRDGRTKSTVGRDLRGGQRPQAASLARFRLKMERKRTENLNVAPVTRESAPRDSPRLSSMPSTL